PYPPTLERGTLHRLPGAKSPDPKVCSEVLVRALIEAEDDTVRIGRHRLRRSSPDVAEAVAATFRDMAKARMDERRPNATGTTWARLEQILDGMLSSEEREDAEIERLLCRTIDGL